MAGLAKHNDEARVARQCGLIAAAMPTAMLLFVVSVELVDTAHWKVTIVSAVLSAVVLLSLTWFLAQNAEHVRQGLRQVD